MRRLLTLVLAIALWITAVPAASAVNGTLVPCKDSQAFLERQQNAPNNYYFQEPYKAYSEYLLCGDEGLPHLVLRFDRALDAALPIALFLYIAGFIGWSGRAYLIAARQSNNPEEKEIFIDIPLALQSMVQGVLWPLAALQEFLSDRLTVKDNEIPVSPR